jgi:dihydroorotase
MTWADVARVMSAIPARIGRVDSGPNAQGRPLAVGEPANITLVDPSARWTVDPSRQASTSRNSPYGGMDLTGRVVATFLRGRPTVLDGVLAVSA